MIDMAMFKKMRLTMPEFGRRKPKQLKFAGGRWSAKSPKTRGDGAK
jgi:hypothetical protein